MLETQFLNPSATARNTTASYLVLAVLKILAGIFSGSVGFIADGADTTVDTAASAIVWAGIKFKKEIARHNNNNRLNVHNSSHSLLDSVNSVIENVAGTFLPMSMPDLVITVEILAHAFYVCGFILPAVCRQKKPKPRINLSIHRLQKQHLLLSSRRSGRSLLRLWRPLG